MDVQETMPMELPDQVKAEMVEQEKEEQDFRHAPTLDLGYWDEEQSKDAAEPANAAVVPAEAEEPLQPPPTGESTQAPTHALEEPLTPAIQEKADLLDASLEQTAASLEVESMDQGDLRRAQLTMRSSERERREAEKESKKVEKQNAPKAAKSKGRPRKQPEHTEAGAAASSPAPAEGQATQTRKRRKSAPDRRLDMPPEPVPAEGDEDSWPGPPLPEEAAPAEVGPKKRKKRKVTKALKEVEADNSTAEAHPELQKKKKKKSKVVPPPSAPEAVEAVLAAAVQKRGKRKGGACKKPASQDEVEASEMPAAAVTGEKPAKKSKAFPKAKAKKAKQEPPTQVDEEMKDEMVALLAKWKGKEYNKDEETYHSSADFGDAITFTVYWTRPAVGIKIWDYEEEEWTQRAYFAKCSLTLCIFMARKYALKLCENGLDWGTSDESHTYRNVLKATATAAEDAANLAVVC